MKLVFACFMAALVTWMSFAFGVRELRGVLSMLETHIVMSSLISRLVLILMFCLAFTFILHLTRLHVLFLSSLMNLTIAHMVLVHESTALTLDALFMAHVLIVVIISRVGLIFLLDGPTPILSRDTWMFHIFPVMVHVPLGQVVRCKRSIKTSSDHIFKCWITKISFPSARSSCVALVQLPPVNEVFSA
jgi:hypothetical protein